MTKATDDPKQDVLRCRALGAPVVFVCAPPDLQWWQLRRERDDADLIETVKAPYVSKFFQAHREELNPRRVYEAKTRGRVQRDRQLHFVDAGLMPLIDEEAGQRLSELIARVVTRMLDRLADGKKSPGKPQERSVFRATFWLLAAKILRDKSVPSFKRVDLLNPGDVFDRVARHYGDPKNVPPLGGRWKDAVTEAAEQIKQFAHLGNLSTEALSYVYENALVSKALRKKLGIHSTPSYLVDYMLWQLAPWIEEIPAEKRVVFEPSCGHAPFLVSAMRLLREIEAGQKLDSRKCNFRRRLIGLDTDSFALEIARLSLTLADVPNPNGWQLRQEDVFASNALDEVSAKAGIFLVNPPFEKFNEEERTKYTEEGASVTHRNKTTEVLGRVLKALPDGAVFGAVVPQGFLHNRDAREIRKLLARKSQLADICLFLGKVFTFANMESAILLGRKQAKPVPRSWTLSYRRIRGDHIAAFRERYAVADEEQVRQSRFKTDPNWSMRIPGLASIWECCRGMPSLAELAWIQQGLAYHGKHLPRDSVTVSDKRAKGLVPGFAKLSSELQIHSLPPQVYMNLDPSVIRRPMAGTTTKTPQVLLNYAPVRCGPWRLKAVIDRDGHAITSRFLAIRPKGNTPLEFLWAICNSPIANAYMFAHSTKREVLAGDMRKMPCPRASEADIAGVVKAARAYLDAVNESENLFALKRDDDGLRELLMRMDAQVLRLYDMPPRVERQLLDVFAGEQRPGVPFRFDRYYPEDFRPCIPLHVYLSQEYRQSTAAELLRRWKPIRSKALIEAIEEAAEAFSED